VAAERLINFEIETSENDLTTWADPDRVAEVLTNLLGNAIKFSPTGGDVTVSLARSGNWVKVSIADTGTGIRPEDGSRIFDKFYQVSHPEQPKANGTGLGLPIAKALVEMHGGRIWLENQAGQGSIFSFTLPVEQPLKLDLHSL
jgi:signal transduction histidine kinase